VRMRAQTSKMLLPILACDQARARERERGAEIQIQTQTSSPIQQTNFFLVTMTSRRRKHDEDSQSPSSAAHGTGEFEKEVRQIHTLLDRIPAPFKEEDFNPLIHVIDIMRAADMKDRKKQLETDCTAVEKAMETIVACTFAI